MHSFARSLEVHDYLKTLTAKNVTATVAEQDCQYYQVWTYTKFSLGVIPFSNGFSCLDEIDM